MGNSITSIKKMSVKNETPLTNSNRSPSHKVLKRHVKERLDKSYIVLTKYAIEKSIELYFDEYFDNDFFNKSISEKTRVVFNLFDKNRNGIIRYENINNLLIAAESVINNSKIICSEERNVLRAEVAEFRKTFCSKSKDNPENVLSLGSFSEHNPGFVPLLFNEIFLNFTFSPPKSCKKSLIKTIIQNYKTPQVGTKWVVAKKSWWNSWVCSIGLYTEIETAENNKDIKTNTGNGQYFEKSISTDDSAASLKNKNQNQIKNKNKTNIFEDREEDKTPFIVSYPTVENLLPQIEKNSAERRLKTNLLPVVPEEKVVSFWKRGHLVLVPSGVIYCLTFWMNVGRVCEKDAVWADGKIMVDLVSSNYFIWTFVEKGLTPELVYKIKSSQLTSVSSFQREIFLKSKLKGKNNSIWTRYPLPKETFEQSPQWARLEIITDEPTPIKELRSKVLKSTRTISPGTPFKHNKETLLSQRRKSSISSIKTEKSVKSEENEERIQRIVSPNTTLQELVYGNSVFLEKSSDRKKVQKFFRSLEKWRELNKGSYVDYRISKRWVLAMIFEENEKKGSLSLMFMDSKKKVLKTVKFPKICKCFENDCHCDAIIAAPFTHSRMKYIETRNKKGVTGLLNLGNTCYMNSALQCLSNAPYLADYFTRGNYKKNLNKNLDCSLVEEFALVLKDIWSGSKSYIKPTSFNCSLNKTTKIFEDNEQHDSHEFLAFLLDELHEKLKRENRRFSRTEDDARRTWNAHKESNDSFIADLFHGQLRSELVCGNKKCGHRSATYDPFMYIPLPIPTKENSDMKINFCRSLGTNSLIKTVTLKFSDNEDIAADKLIKKTAKQIYKDSAEFNKTNKLYIVALLKGNTILKIINRTESVLKYSKRGDIWLFETEVIDKQQKIAERRESKNPSELSKNSKNTTNSKNFKNSIPNGSAEDRKSKELMAELKNELKEPTLRRKSSLERINGVNKGSERNKINPFSKIKNDGINKPFGEIEKSPKKLNSVKDKINSAKEKEKRRFLEEKGKKRGTERLQEKKEIKIKKELMRNIELKIKQLNFHATKENLKIGQILNVSEDEIVTPPVIFSYGENFETAETFKRKCHSFEDTNLFDLKIKPIENDNENDNEDITMNINGDKRDLIKFSKNKIKDIFLFDKRGKLKSRNGANLSNYGTVTAVIVWDELSRRTQKDFELPMGNKLPTDFKFKINERNEKLGNSTSKTERDITLRGCFESYTRREVLRNSWRCPECGESQKSTKRLELWSLPALLIVQIKRFNPLCGDFGEKEDMKSRVLVDYPLEDLNLSDFCVDKTENSCYDLFAVSNHYGISCVSGHYTAFAKNLISKKWYHFNDEICEKARETDLVSRNAYILFYKRKDIE